MALSQWTGLAIAGAFGIGLVALIAHKLSGPISLTRNWQRLGDFAVFDALFCVGWKRSARRERLELRIYATLRKSPLERDDGQIGLNGQRDGGAHGRGKQRPANSSADLV